MTEDNSSVRIGFKLDKNGLLKVIITLEPNWGYHLKGLYPHYRVEKYDFCIINGETVVSRIDKNPLTLDECERIRKVLDDLKPKGKK